eukprot:CAMPEP_0172538878 /NCGR_PEP_ID=MMETSP1067-20121228/10188_1 /TAXON_ID=265564 ORGANISM="Thalassiosira punctigera, Strain Tpunct2005C2" /NCGR_SAMPLE_ID=MMETSP1067 /ASSEMBLY_ACC=CAM_ASM_000444 /LENGTH=172 /DNA_ID=CAMNT_0013324471 /DNA_START=12 /DNA_END=527 /DNA_ORIENTATION=+
MTIAQRRQSAGPFPPRGVAGRQRVRSSKIHPFPSPPPFSSFVAPFGGATNSSAGGGFPRHRGDVFIVAASPRRRSHFCVGLKNKIRARPSSCLPFKYRLFDRASGMAGLARLCPAKLRNHRVISLELANLMAGTKYRGEFEERLQAIVEEATDEKAHPTILFIDEIHTLVGA